MSPMEPPFNSSPSEGPAPELDRRSKQRRTTARFWIALLAGLCLVGFPIFFYLISRAEVNANRGHLRTPLNMVRMGSLFNVYADTSRGNLWPGLADNERIWAPDLSVLYPKSLQDTSVLVAIEHPEADHIRASLRAVLEGPNPDYNTAAGLMALSFAYLGCATYDEEGFSAIVRARRAGLIDGSGEFVKLTDGGDMVYPFREGIERFLITDVNGPWAVPPGLMSSIPVLVETWQWKSKAAGQEFRDCNVLYLDGHVKRVPLGTFPVVPEVMNALCGLTR